MPVKHLVVENFKSYSGTQQIGPFKDFTCVIGPNGSGKSNLMDALSFVLGVNQKDLRSSHLKDLVFRPPNQRPGSKSMLKASVTLVYAASFDADAEETSFTREISTKATNEYKVNGKKVTFEEYQNELVSRVYCVCVVLCVVCLCVLCVLCVCVCARACAR